MGTVKIGDAFSEGWNMFKENMGLCILVSLIAMLIGGVSCGICFGPMSCGVFMVLRRLARKSDPKPDVGDVFKGFDVFLHSFLLVLICGICYYILQVLLVLIPILGLILSIILGFIYSPIQTWALMLIANRNMKWTEAIGLVLKETFNGKFMIPLLLGVLAGIVGGVGVILCGVGLIFTVPFSLCVFAAAYEHVFGSAEAPAPQAAVEPEVVA